MNVRPGPRWTLAMLAFVATAGVWFWFVVLHGDVLRLADGREVTIRAVTHGTNHVFVEGAPWLRLLQPFVSPAKAYQLGLRVYQFPTLTPTLMIWTGWRLPSTNLPPRFASVCDRYGVESEPQVALVESASLRARTKDFMAWQLANYPRRQNKILLRFYERDAAYCPHRVGEFSVRIPGGGEGHDWRAPAPPVRVERDGREFTLKALLGGEPKPPELKWPYTFVAPWTTAVFEVRENGQPTEAWTIKSLEVLGATGNRFTIAQPSLGRVSGQLATAFPQVLWRDEPDWRFLVEFSRARDFAAEDLWTIQSIPAGRDRPPFTTNFEETAQGVLFQTLDIRATGEATRAVRGGYRRTSDLTLLFSSVPPGIHVDLARVLDSRGREVRFGHGWEPWKGKYVAGLELPLETTSLDLTFAVHKSQRIEFVARPPR